MTGDTIAAIATALGEGGIATIRISGPQALLVADRVFYCLGPPPSQRPAQTFAWGHMHDLERQIDEGIILIMHAPHSYTREDVVELQCHGGLIIPRQVLRAVLQAGARMAEPGEFTYRAFINGRLDLVQAESVNDLIRARSDRAVRVAKEYKNGRFSKQFREFYDHLLSIASDLEASLAFHEDELPQTVLPDILNQLELIELKIFDFLKNWQNGHYVREGISLVIAGRPNVGKSSLMNALLGKDRVIVSHQPGTTRDVIEEFFIVDGMYTRLFDTAGLRNAECAAEEDGIRRAYDVLRKADIVIYVVDASNVIQNEDIIIIKSLPTKRCLLVLNKVDLGCLVSNPLLNDFRTIETSALLSVGIKEVVREISILVSNFVQLNSFPETIITDRHWIILSETRKILNDGISVLRSSGDQVIAANFVRLAINSIGNLLGRDTTDDVLSSVFSKFCIGK